MWAFLVAILALGGWLGPSAALSSRPSLAAESVTPALGGATSRPTTGEKAFTFPLANLASEDERAFFFGNRLFNTNWVQAPGSVDAFDGLGPVFNRVSCAGCHTRDGRGRPPEPGEPLESMLLRLSLAGTDEHGGPRPHPSYGDQLNDRAILGVPAEGRVEIAYAEARGTFDDGTPYSLRRPVYTIADPAFGAIGQEVLLSPRVAPQVIGLGLLEAVPEATILALADPEDADGDGISGRPNRVWDIEAEAMTLGRLGWKANQPSLRQQNAGAAFGDIGLTSSLHPVDNCSAGQEACASAIGGGSPELPEAFLEKLTLYTRALAVPMQRHVDDSRVQEGFLRFLDSGCDGCHVPTLRTGPAAMPALADQTIHPFTDLLLHDMGPDLADGRPDFDASGQEWRTPPLWGLGLVEAVNRHTFLLHDGRARSFAEAILWHGGEAEAARRAFKALPAADRDALLAFLESL